MGQLTIEVLCHELKKAVNDGVTVENFTKDICGRFAIKPASLSVKISQTRAELKAASAIYSYKKKEYNGVELAVILGVDKITKVGKAEGVTEVKAGYELPYLAGSGTRGATAYDRLALVAELQS